MIRFVFQYHFSSCSVAWGAGEQDWRRKSSSEAIAAIWKRMVARPGHCAWNREMWTLLKTIHVWEKDSRHVIGELWNIVLSYSFSTGHGGLEKVDVVGIRKGENGAEVWTEDVLILS